MVLDTTSHSTAPPIANGEPRGTAASFFRATRVPILAVLFVGLFGVLLASFPAHNLDAWQHLAAGRNLARNFAHGVIRLDPTWLYDLVSYVVFSITGGAGLAVAKALVCSATAVLVFRLARVQGGWRIPLLVTVLAVLAMGTRMLLQPATISVLFLALAVWMLFWKGASSPGLDGSWPGWWLVGLFVIWANVDEWFVLGLVVVGLSWFGRLLDSPPPGGFGRALGRWVGGVGILVVAACLSPSHVNGLHVPSSLRTAVVALREGASSGGQALNSPFAQNYLSAFRDSPAALCYYPLLGFGLLAFVLNRGGWRWAWFLPWLGLAVVSGIQARTVPFFAVVAGPVLAWNLQEVFARRGELPPARPRVRYAAWGLTLVLAAAILVCAWPGWLQGQPYEPRQWVIENPTALRLGADFLCRGHADGLWRPETRTLHVSPGTVSVFAWFCPEDQSLRDEAIIAALLKPNDPEDAARSQLRALGVNRIVVSAADRDSLPLMGRLLADPVEWPVLHLTGGLVVFGCAIRPVSEKRTHSGVGRWISTSWRSVRTSRKLHPPPVRGHSAIIAGGRRSGSRPSRGHPIGMRQRCC